MSSHGRRVWVVLACALGALTLQVGAQAEEAKGSIDWEKKVIRATGAGAPDLKAPNIAVARLGAERAAKLDALRNILETLRGVEVTTGSSAGGIMASDSAVKAKVEGLVRSFKVVDTRYFSDGGVEVDVEMSLDGELARALMPPEEKKAPPTGGEKGYTGLVVDARGKGLKRALAPRIKDESGRELFGPDFVQADAMRERGVVGYARSMDEASGDARVGDHPLVVKALKTEGSDVILTNLDAAPFHDGKKDLSFLADGRVIIVAD